MAMVSQKFVMLQGFGGDWRNAVMAVLACCLLALALWKRFAPSLLLPVAFGMLLSNIAPFLMAPLQGGVPGGVLYYLSLGLQVGIYPSLIFLGVGAMTDFGPLIASPKSFLFGAFAQAGVFLALPAALWLGFLAPQAGAVSILGGANAPLAIFTASRLAPEFLGPLALAACCCAALTPALQPLLMRALTTRKERMVRMKPLRPISKRQKLLFAACAAVLLSLLLPQAAPLLGMLLLGNLMRECGANRLSRAARNGLKNFAEILLGLSAGALATGRTLLRWETLWIFALGFLALALGTVGALLLGKLLCRLSNWRVNPLLGGAAVFSPAGARIAQKLAQSEDPENFLWEHAAAANAAGLFAAVAAAGVLLKLLGQSL